MTAPGAGGTTPLQSLDVLDLIAPQIVLLCVSPNGSQSTHQARSGSAWWPKPSRRKSMKTMWQDLSRRNETVLESALKE